MTPSLGAGWTVLDVVAHLTAGAAIGRFRWLASMIGARFDDSRHNQHWIARHHGATPVRCLSAGVYVDAALAGRESRVEDEVVVVVAAVLVPVAKWFGLPEIT